MEPVSILPQTVQRNAPPQDGGSNADRPVSHKLSQRDNRRPASRPPRSGFQPRVGGRKRDLPEPEPTVEQPVGSGSGSRTEQSRRAFVEDKRSERRDRPKRDFKEKRSSNYRATARGSAKAEAIGASVLEADAKKLGDIDSFEVKRLEREAGEREAKRAEKEAEELAKEEKKKRKSRRAENNYVSLRTKFNFELRREYPMKAIMLFWVVAYITCMLVMFFGLHMLHYYFQELVFYLLTPEILRSYRWYEDVIDWENILVYLPYVIDLTLILWKCYQCHKWTMAFLTLLKKLSWAGGWFPTVWRPYETYHYSGDVYQPTTDDVRGDSSAMVDLKHVDPDLKLITAKVKRPDPFEDNVLLEGLFPCKYEEKRLTVSMELLEQIESAAINMSLLSDPKTAYERIFNYATRVQTINIDRVHIVQHKQIVSDTAFLAFKMLAKYHEERDCLDFPIARWVKP